MSMLMTTLTSRDISIDLGANFVCRVSETLIAFKNSHRRV